jgi:hypothetical protein
MHIKQGSFVNPAVLRIRIRILIVFLGLPDPDPDPSIIMQNSKKNVDPTI